MKRSMPILCNLLFLMATMPGFAQVRDDSPLTLERFMGSLASPDRVELPRVTETIRVRGLGFEMNENVLAQILKTSREAARDPLETAKLIIQMFQVCADCGDRYFGKWSKEDFLLLLDRRKVPSDTFLKEVRQRGVTGISKTIASINELRQLGASDKLIEFLVPFDEIEEPAPDGYKREALLRSAYYDRALPLGSITVLAKVSGKVEFLFQNNSMFVRPLPRTDKKTKDIASGYEIVSSTFTAPISKSNPAASLSANALEKPAKARTAAPALTNAEGHFRFTIDEPDKVMHLYEIKIKYQTPQSPQMK